MPNSPTASRRRLAFRAAALLSIVLALGACSDTPKPAPDDTKTPVSIATSKNVWNALPIIAKEQRFFEAEGLDVEMNYLAAGKYCLDALLADSVDFGMIVEVNVAYLGYTGAPNVAVIATIAESDGSAVIARRSRGINSPADLRGKRLALSAGTTSELFANRLMQKHGLTASDLDVRRIQPNGMFGAMAGGDVDAASTWEPFVHNIRRSLGDDAIVFRDRSIYIGYMNVAVRKDWASANDETVAAFLRALRSAAEFARDRPDDAQQTLARVTNLEPDVVAAMWKYFVLELGLDTKQLTADIVAEGQWIRESQEAFASKPAPNYAAYVDASFLELLH